MKKSLVEQLDLRALQVLDALLTEKNATRAAQRLGVTPSAVSHALARLREVLDDPLFVRTPRGMTPTPRASRMAGPLREALTQLDRAVGDDESFDPAGLVRTFKLSSADYGVHVLVPGLIRVLSQESPHVDVLVMPQASPAAVEVALETGELDVAIGRLPNMSSALRQQALFEDRFRCIVRRGHPLVRRSLDLDLYVTLGHVLVAPYGRPGSLIDDVLEKQGRRRRIALTVPHFLAAFMVVAESDFILTASERLARYFQDILPIKVLAPPLPFEPYTISQVWHERMHADPAHRWLRGQLRRVAEPAGPAEPTEPGAPA
jgi:DNA-binding transcriptional LysR family regulator